MGVSWRKVSHGRDEARLVDSARRARQREYAELAAAALALHGAASMRAGRMSPATARARLPALQRQLEGIVAADHFEAQGRRDAVAALHRLTRLTGDAAAASGGARAAPRGGRTLGTRAGGHIHRAGRAPVNPRFLGPATRHPA